MSAREWRLSPDSIGEMTGHGPRTGFGYVYPCPAGAMASVDFGEIGSAVGLQSALWRVLTVEEGKTRIGAWLDAREAEANGKGGAA